MHRPMMINHRAWSMINFQCMMFKKIIRKKHLFSWKSHFSLTSCQSMWYVESCHFYFNIILLFLLVEKLLNCRSWILSVVTWLQQDVVERQVQGSDEPLVQTLWPWTRSRHLSEPQFPHLENGWKDLWGLLKGLSIFDLLFPVECL